jgi:hypothetical protein
MASSALRTPCAATMPTSAASTSLATLADLIPPTLRPIREVYDWRGNIGWPACKAQRATPSSLQAGVEKRLARNSVAIALFFLKLRFSRPSEFTTRAALENVCLDVVRQNCRGFNILNSVSLAYANRL